MLLSEELFTREQTIVWEWTVMEELMTNPRNLEKFAREKYLMKKDDEDVFVIVKEEE